VIHGVIPFPAGLANARPPGTPVRPVRCGRRVPAVYFI